MIPKGIKSFLKLIQSKSTIFPNSESCKMSIIVRTDIKMGSGKIGAQCAHAAVECYRLGTNCGKYENILKTWVYSGQPKIILRAASERELYNLERNAKLAGVITAVIRDAGRTQLKQGTVSVLGIGPAPKDVVDKLTCHLKLL
ncbi:peptidyl-tRNA hydrolase 2, mitochondrial-like [Prorops nasuta]|uniref:peptidyl-tRNA hydrolase 2, mitochondrial-like n=1 Tax=Prorops nasuta TaxID=863751 RepID=UPI0034CF0A55